jgi:hypothetical protein
MTFYDQNDREEDLKTREKAIQERELAIRLKELEAEVQSKSKNNEIKISVDYLSNPDSTSLKNRFKEFLKWSKVVGFTILGLTIAFVGVFVGVWLVYVALLGGVGLISYHLLFSKSRSNRS